ncbi:hypothetical protein AMTRI_Chr03g140690 [Amborella trichopoda]
MASLSLSLYSQSTPSLFNSTCKPLLPSESPISLRKTPLHFLHSQNFGRNSSFRVSSSSPTISSPKPTSSGVSPPVTETKVARDGNEFDWFSNWYPIAPVCDLDKRVPHASRVLGLDVVVWWDKAEGKWQVFDDKCPHRLAPLSEGRIDQWGRLQCVYHGWCFGGSGNCKLIPQSPPDGPQVHTSRKACVAVYPSLEQNGIVWFWPNPDHQLKDISSKKSPPFISELDDPSYTHLMGMRDMPYGYEVLIENLMDPAHVPYAHRGLMRTSSNPRPVDREGGRPLDISILSQDISGFLANQEFGYGKFIAPCIFYVSAFSGSTNESISQEPAADDHKPQRPAADYHKPERLFLLIFVCIPVSPGRSRLIWSFPRNFSVWIDKLVPRWIFHLGQNLILDSDLYLVHLEELKIMEIGQSNWLKSCFVPTKSDALVIAFRNWLRKYCGGQIDWGTKFHGYLPPTPPKEQLMDRYWSHVVHCSSCRAALKYLKALEICLQTLSITLIGVVAVFWQSIPSTVARILLVSAAILSSLASRWLADFIYKNFYFHDYNHALI